MAEKKRILVVDDDRDFVAVLKVRLGKEGFEVDAAYDGLQALERVNESTPDAIVLDVMMPEKNGYQVCAELKANEAFAGIPIVMLTAVASWVGTTRYSHLGGMTMKADEYIPKPASPDQIVNTIKALVS